MPPETTINSEPRCKVKLMKMSKGYQWEISVSGDDAEKCMNEAHHVDTKMVLLYPESAKS